MSGRHANVSAQSSQSLTNGGTSATKGVKTHWRQVLRKACTTQSTWDDKDDLLDAIYWLRQIISLIIGIVWACVPLKGFLAIALYVAINSLIVHLYVTSFQKADEDELGGAWEIAKEGFGAGFATFMVIWIVGYSALNFS